jgi:HSP20 family protein
MVDFRSLVPWRERSQTLAPREDFFDPFVSFRREVDRMFDSFLDGFGTRALAPAGWQGLNPAVDMRESDNELMITAEVPGVDEKDVEVTLTDNVLTIKGEKKAQHEQKNGDASYMERRYGAFSRSLRLPFAIKDEEIDAKYDKGVLTITIPKPAEAQTNVRRIEVKGA